MTHELQGKNSLNKRSFFESIAFKQETRIRENILDTIEKTTGITIDLDNSQPGDVVKI